MMRREELEKKYPNMEIGIDGEFVYFEANAQRFSCVLDDNVAEPEELLEDEGFCTFLDKWFNSTE